MSQTAYGLQQTPQPGVLFDISEVEDVFTYVNQDGTWNIPFGVMLARKSTSETQAKLPNNSTDEMVGISLLAHVYDPGPNGTLDQVHTIGVAPGPGVKQNQNLSTLRRGRVWTFVETDVAILAGGKAFVRVTQNGAGKLQLGALRADADGGNAVAVHGRFMTASKLVPATAFPGQSGGAQSSNFPAVGIPVNTAVLEFDAADF